VRRGEQHFKDRVNTIKHDMVNKEKNFVSAAAPFKPGRSSLVMSTDMGNEQLQSASVYSFGGPRREVSLKLAVQ